MVFVIGLEHDIDMPSFTKEAACFLSSGPIKFIVAYAWVNNNYYLLSEILNMAFVRYIEYIVKYILGFGSTPITNPFLFLFKN